MEDNQGGGVGAFAEEEANKKRQKKEDSVSEIIYSTDNSIVFGNQHIVWHMLIDSHSCRENKLTTLFTRREDTLSRGR